MKLFTPAVAAISATMTSLVIAEVPVRTISGATLVAPSAHQESGDPWFVAAGPDIQVTFISDAPFERITGTSSSVVGYIVPPPLDQDLPESFEFPGAFRLAVASIDTGIALRNQHLQSDRWLNAAVHPDVEFELRRADDVKETMRDDERKVWSYAMTLVGDMTIMGATKLMSIPAKLTIMHEAPQAVRGGGTLVALKCDYLIDIADFSPELLTSNASVFGTRVATEINISQFLLFNPRSPDINLDRFAQQWNTSNEVVAQVLQFQRLLIAHHDADAAYAFGNEVMVAAWQNAEVLNILASLATNDAASRNDLRFAMKAANRACELTNNEDAMMLDTLASVHFMAGDVAAAVTTQRLAVEHVEGAPDRFKAVIRSNLEKYEQSSE